MNNGLSMSLDEFEALPSKKQLSCLYENQCKTLLEVKGHRFHQKVQYPWLAGLTGAVIFIIKWAVNN